MKKIRLVLILALVGLVVQIAWVGDSSAVQVDVYSGFTPSGGGPPYSGFVGSFTSPDITFGADTNWNWHPFGLARFGAEITGTLIVEFKGPYHFVLESADGSQLFIDGKLVSNSGGVNTVTALNTYPALTPGEHNFEIHFFENGKNPSGVNLLLPTHVTLQTEVPEPSTVLLLGSGLAGLGGVTWRRLRRGLPHTS